MSAADRFIYEQAQLTNTPESPFLKKEVIYISDTNSSSTYTGQITYDFSQISNSVKWADWGSSETVLEIPFSILIQNTSGAGLLDMSTVVNSYVAGLKNGTHHIVNSLTITVNNTSVTQLSNYLNHYISYKLMSEMSPAELKKWGASLFFAPDGATSVHWDDVGTSLDGEGLSNNRPTYDAATNFDYSTKDFKFTNNQGFNDRLRNVLDFSAGALNDTMSVFSTTASSTTNAISQFRCPAVGGGDVNRAVIHLLATIRMRDLADVFAQLPLCRGTYIQMILNYNASSQNISFNNGTGVFTCDTPQITGLTNPIIVSSAATSQPNNWMATQAANTSFFVACNVGSVQDNTGARIDNPLLMGRTRLSIPLYSMNPIFEQRYLSLKTKDVYYSDIYTYVYTNITAGQPFSFLATNGISNVEEVIVIPYIHKDANGVPLSNLTKVPVYQSPFASEPGTPSPILLTQFQVQLSGSNLFQSDFQYDYQAYLTELAATGLNGGESVLTSGLVSQQDFQYCYRYYVANASRRLPMDDIARSVNILGINNSTKPIDLLVVIRYQRKLTIDLATGALLPTIKA